MEMENKNEAEFTIQDIVPIAAALIVAGIFIGYGVKIQSDVRATFVTNAVGCNSTDKTLCNYDYNSSGEAMTGVTKLSGQLPTIGLVAAAVVVIGMLGYLVFRK